MTGRSAWGWGEGRGAADRGSRGPGEDGIGDEGGDEEVEKETTRRPGPGDQTGRAGARLFYG